MTLARNAFAPSIHKTVLLGFLVCAGALATDRDTGSLNVSSGHAILTVESPRPVAKAIQVLMDRYGIAITYEDPRYAFEDDLEDETAKVRKDIDKYLPGKAPKVIGPKGDVLTVNSSSTDLVAILTQLVQAQSSSRYGGHFRVEQGNNIFHVVPTEVRDRNGNWANRGSILDIPISLPTQNRTFEDALETILAEITAATHVKVAPPALLGMGRGTGSPPTYQIGADREPARNVLTRLLAAVATDRVRLTWFLYYGNDATDSSYVFNLLPVPDPPVSSDTLKTP